MGKKTKIWLIVAGSAILLGCIIFGVVMSMLGWDFTKLSTVQYVTNEHSISEKFEHIRIDTKTADIVFAPSEDGNVRVVYREEKKVAHTATVEDGTLVISVVDTRKWYDYIGINFGSPGITVYIPQGQYGALSVKSDTGKVELPQNFGFESIDVTVDTGNVICRASSLGNVKIRTSTGKISVENITAGAVDLTTSTGNVVVANVNCQADLRIDVDTGDVNITDVRCRSLVSDGDTGDIVLQNVIAFERFSIERDTGNVQFVGCDAGEIFVETDTGDVKGSLLSEKMFIAHTDTGRVNVPQSVTGGKCQITTDTGNIQITVAK